MTNPRSEDEVPKTESEKFLEELREFANAGRSCSRAAVRWAVSVIEPLIESVKAWERDDEGDGDEDDGT